MTKSNDKKKRPTKDTSIQKSKVGKSKKKKRALLKSLNKKLKSTHKNLTQKIIDLSKQLEELEFQHKSSLTIAINKLQKQHKKRLSKQKKTFKKQVQMLAENHDDKIRKLKISIIKDLDTAKETEKKPSKKITGKNIIKPSLASIKGIGPITLKKLNEAGINTLEDLINASQETLHKFKAMRGSASWIEQAKTIQS